MSETPIHQAFWLLRQLHKGKSNPEHFINFRCVHNGKPYLDSVTGKTVVPSEVTYDEFVKVRDFEEAWTGRLCNKLHTENGSVTKPSNVYFAINPLENKSHKKAAFAGFAGFYLDLDSNKGYTKEQRAAQIYYWTRLGFKPSITVDSGHGYHLYWILKRLLEREIGERMLKRMVALSGCREGGNTFDISRVFRLPGFRNVKEWFNDDTPPCGIVLPDYDPTSTPATDAITYDVEKFASFPPSTLDDLTRYYNEARRLTGDDTARFEENVQFVLAGALQRQQELEATLAGASVAAQNQSQSQVEPAADGNGEFTPKLKVIPPVSDIKFGRNEAWIKKYCQRGHAGLNQGEIDEIKMKLNIEDASASELDFRVMYALAKKGYTKAAVREFWIRGDVKLYRPDKESKNANYFDMSYDKALSYVQAARKQIDEEKKNGGVQKQILVAHNQTFFSDGENSELIISAEMRLNAIYVDKDGMLPCEQEMYDIDAVYLDPNEHEGLHTLNLLMPRTAFNSIAEFKKYCSDMLCCMTDKNSHLQHLIKHLKYAYRNAPIHRFHSKMTFVDDHFVFPTYSIYADRIEQNESDRITENMQKKIPMFQNFAAEFKTDAQASGFLRRHWGDILRCHLPRVVASVFGFIAANAISAVFKKQLCLEQFHIPTINIRGGSSTAKTETVKYLLTFAGLRPTGNTIGLSSSEFAITQYAGSTNFLPILIDEFKIEGNNDKYVSNVRSVFRRMYSGEMVIKGRRDMSVTATTLHGALLVVGEHPLERIGDISEISRMFPVDTDEYHPEQEGNFERWKRISTQYMYMFGPKFYQWLLQQDIVALHGEFEAMKTEVTDEVKNSFGGERYRVAHNLAALWFGCKLIDRFIKSICDDAPTIEHVCDPKGCIVNYMCGWAESTGQTMKVKTLVENQETHVVEEKTTIMANNEILSLIKTFGTMIESRDKIIRDLEAANVMVYHENEKTEQLYVSMPTMFNAFTIYVNTYRRGVVPPESKIKIMLRAAEAGHEPWIVAASKVVKVKGLTYRCIVLNARALRQMGLWPAKTLISCVPSGDAPDTAEQPTQPATPTQETTGTIPQPTVTDAPTAPLASSEQPPPDVPTLF